MMSCLHGQMAIDLSMTRVDSVLKMQSSWRWGLVVVISHRTLQTLEAEGRGTKAAAEAAVKAKATKYLLLSV